MAQDIDEAVHLHGGLEGLIEFLLRIELAALDEDRPGHRLGVPHEVAERGEIQGIVFLQDAEGIPDEAGTVAIVGGFRPAAGRRNEPGFDIGLKLLLVFWHGQTTFRLPVTVSKIRDFL